MDVSAISTIRKIYALGILEAGAAAVGRVDAFERQVAASMAWIFAIALDFATFALVAGNGYVSGALSLFTREHFESAMLLSLRQIDIPSDRLL